MRWRPVNFTCIPEAQTKATLTKGALLRWFYDDQSGDANWILGRIALERPDIFHEHLREANAKRAEEAAAKKNKTNVMNTVTDTRALVYAGSDNEMEIPLVQDIGLDPENTGVTPEPEVLEESVAHEARSDSMVGWLASPTNLMDELPMVQFTADTYYSLESDSHAVLDVMRLGNLTQRSVVAYRTMDVTAKAGHAYAETSGYVIFETGEYTAKVHVPLIDNEEWNTMVEFQLDLLEDNIQNAVLGRYLWMASVKVIDDDCFPTNKYRVQIHQGEQMNIPAHELLREYYRHCLTDPTVRLGTAKMATVDFLHNIHAGVKLIVNVYLVDRILKPRADGRESSDLAVFWELVVCSSIIVVPLALLHFLDWKKPLWKVGGRCRAVLQSGLFRKHLNYNEASRAKVAPGALIMACTRDCSEVVGRGYMGVLTLLRSFLNVLLMVLFKIVANKTLGAKFSPSVMIALVAFPLLLFPFLICKKNDMVQSLVAQDAAQDAFVDHITNTVEMHGLITDYSQKANACTHFENKLAGFNKCTVNVIQVMININYFVQWVVNMIIGIYIVYRGMLVVQGQCTLGIYLMDIQIFLSMGTAYGQIYKCLMEMLSVQPSLCRIIALMNMETDLRQRMSLRQLNQREHTAVRANRKDLHHPDDLPMIVCEPYFAIVRRGRTINHFQGNLSLDLGQLIGIVGPPGRGKTTLLKLIAGSYLPEVFGGEEGMIKRIFVPPYMRMLHVQERPTFFYGTLLANLTYGCRLNDADSRPSRVRNICHKLGLDEEVLDYLRDGDERKQSWGEVFSNTKICLLSLARALVFNPEILCCHKPVLPYSDEVKHEVMQILKNFVDKCGIEQPDISKHMRRPRTCLVTTSHMLGLSACHQLVYVHNFEMSILNRRLADSGEEVIEKDGLQFSLSELTTRGGMMVGRNSLRDSPEPCRESPLVTTPSQDLKLRSPPSREAASVVQSMPPSTLAI